MGCLSLRLLLETKYTQAYNYLFWYDISGDYDGTGGSTVVKVLCYKSEYR